MSSISAGTTTTTGYVVSSDTTGALVLKTGASGTTALTIGSDQSVTFVGSQTLSGGTANGVLYLNGSKVATSGSALVFDGTNLGVGTSSPNYRLDVAGTSNATALGTTLAYGISGEVYSAFRFGNSSFSGGNSEIRNYVNGAASTGSALTFSTTQTGTTTLTERLRIDNQGNLGLGVTPSAWSAYKPYQVGWGALASTSASQNTLLSSNVYFDGSTFKYIGTGTASYLQQFEGAFIWKNAASGTAGNAITFTQAMTLNASGNLGVGTTSPTTARLQATPATNPSPPSLGSGAGTLFISSANGLYGLYAGTTSDGYSWLQSTRNDSSGTAYAIVMQPSGGPVYINATSAPSWGDANPLLQVGGSRPVTINTTGGNVSMKADGGGWGMGSYIYGSSGTYRGGFGFLGSGDSVSYYWVGTAYNGTGVSLTYGATSWAALSDIRDKNVHGVIENALQKVSGIRAVYYNYKSDEADKSRRVGFIAQEVQAVLPEAVENVQREINEDATEETRRLVLSYTDVIPLLTAAIQEQQALIESLTQRIAALEGQP